MLSQGIIPFTNFQLYYIASTLIKFTLLMFVFKAVFLYLVFHRFGCVGDNTKLFTLQMKKLRLSLLGYQWLEPDFKAPSVALFLVHHPTVILAALLRRELLWGTLLLKPDFFFLGGCCGNQLREGMAIFRQCWMNRGVNWKDGETEWLTVHNLKDKILVLKSTESFDPILYIYYFGFF